MHNYHIIKEAISIPGIFGKAKDSANLLAAKTIRSSGSGNFLSEAARGGISGPMDVAITAGLSYGIPAMAKITPHVSSGIKKGFGIAGNVLNKGTQQLGKSRALPSSF